MDYIVKVWLDVEQNKSTHFIIEAAPSPEEALSFVRERCPGCQHYEVRDIVDAEVEKND